MEGGRPRPPSSGNGIAMKYKANWVETQERLTTLWEGRPTDRPCLAISVPNANRVSKPGDRWDHEEWYQEPPRDAETRWLDEDWVIRHALNTIKNTWWGGESIPSYLLLAGWLMSLGGRPRFDFRTIWFEEFPVDFGKPHPFHNDPDDPWLKRYIRLYHALARAAGRDDFLLGSPALMPAHDLLSMHMGTQNFLMALVDEPEWMLRAITEGARDQIATRQKLWAPVRERHLYWYGNSGWMPFWAPKPYNATQSDVSCMLSPEMFEQFVMPELDLIGNEFGAMWYHLDGGDALQHLPRLLSLPYLRVIQYVPRPTEPPNGVAHIDLYRRVQKAGRIVHVEVSPDQVEPLCRALDPRLLMLDLTSSVKSPAEAGELIAAAKRWTSAKYSK